MKYYLAGKIWKNDWRSALLGDRGGNASDNYTCDEASLDPNIVRNGIPNFCGIPTATYSGPFFLSCDHGCYHGQTKHGQLSWNDANKAVSSDWDPDGDIPASQPELIDPTLLSEHGGTGQSRQIVVRNCLRWVAASDVVIARLSDDNPSGTLVELGFAAALRKQTFVWYTSEQAKLLHWFPAFLDPYELCHSHEPLTDTQGAAHIRDLVKSMEDWADKEPLSRKEEYSLLLKSEEWAVKRREVFNAFGRVCNRCRRRNVILHVHHKAYLPNTLPWDYPLSNFEVLCKGCHEKHHNIPHQP